MMPFCGPVQQNTKSECMIIYPTISPCKLPVARSSAILLIGHSVSWLVGIEMQTLGRESDMVSLSKLHTSKSNKYNN